MFSARCFGTCSAAHPRGCPGRRCRHQRDRAVLVQVAAAENFVGKDLSEVRKPSALLSSIIKRYSEAGDLGANFDGGGGGYGGGGGGGSGYGRHAHLQLPQSLDHTSWWRGSGTPWGCQGVPRARSQLIALRVQRLQTATSGTSWNVHSRRVNGVDGVSFLAGLTRCLLTRTLCVRAGAAAGLAAKRDLTVLAAGAAAEASRPVVAGATLQAAGPPQAAGPRTAEAPAATAGMEGASAATAAAEALPAAEGPPLLAAAGQAAVALASWDLTRAGQAPPRQVPFDACYDFHVC